MSAENVTPATADQVVRGIEAALRRMGMTDDQIRQLRAVAAELAVEELREVRVDVCPTCGGDASSLESAGGSPVHYVTPCGHPVLITFERIPGGRHVRLTRP